MLRPRMESDAELQINRDEQLIMSQLYNDTEFHIGLALAISSSVFIGSSFIIKKKALIRIGRSGSVRASAGGFGYLRDWMWWIGFLSSKQNLSVQKFLHS